MSNNKDINIEFSPEQRKLLKEVFPSLNREQSEFIKTVLDDYISSGAADEVAESSSSGSIPLTIIYGSESGNSESLAAEAAKRAKKLGFKPVVKDMFDTSVAELKEAANLLVFLATWGEGDPPERAEEFYANFISDEYADDLSSVNYAVCALGDSSYVDFCEVGIKLDEKLEKLKANKINNRIDCDVDFQEIASNWTNDSIKELLIANGVDVSELETESESKFDFSKYFGATEYTPQAPFIAEISEKALLNDEGSNKETYHIEISLEGSGLEYEVGDALGVIPENDQNMVKEILSTINLDGNAKLSNGSSLNEALSFDYDINAVTKPVIKAYGELTGNEEAISLAESGDIAEYTYGRELIDLLKDYPADKAITADEFISILRKIPPRLYSIASAQEQVGEEVHLTIAIVRYNSHDRDRGGVASTFFADRIDVGGKVKVYPKANKNFRLPENNNTPVIMVGPGTGIAPFRAFMQKRDEENAQGKNWLFFGDQHFLHDFLYQLEWQEYYNKGLLTKFDAAFSRDTPEKVYVQNRMWEKRSELFEWLEEGAYFYVCGDESRMAKDVDYMLHKLIAEASGKGEEFAAEYVTNLKKSERYLRDVY